jgi:hypothetical protein
MNSNLINHSVLHEKWWENANKYMSRKLTIAKSDIKLDIPESFVFSKRRVKAIEGKDLFKY